ncbi:hypothetical protein NQD34_016667 [Periophthalmus magnuspinnatus]|nr:hypothetical protein NQD34_016667 [Periophthalmus magnuspinnatus]
MCVCLSFLFVAHVCRSRLPSEPYLFSFRLCRSVAHLVALVFQIHNNSTHQTSPSSVEDINVWSHWDQDPLPTSHRRNKCHCYDRAPPCGQTPELTSKHCMKLKHEAKVIMIMCDDHDY